jgi:hypothetical protein
MNTSSRRKIQKPPETPSSRKASPRIVASKAARKPYNRLEQLPRLIGLWPHEVEDCSETASERIVALLRKALRGERQRGIGGHWTYDVNRHMALSEALREENERLRIVKGLAAAGALPSRPKDKAPPAQDEKRPRAEILHLPFGKTEAAK